MHKTKLFITILLIIGLLSCGKSENNPLIGFWKQEKPLTYLNILKNGENFIVERYANDMGFGNFQKSEYPASINGNNLSITLPGDKLSGFYKESDNTLVLNGRETYCKIMGDQALADINKRLKTEHDSKALCKEIQQEVNEKKKTITDKDEWNKYVIALQSRIPKGCTILGDGMAY